MKKILLPSVLLCVLWGSPAHAGVPECGNTLIDATASCAIVVDANCDAQCKIESSLISRCAADLAAACDAGCTTEISGDQEVEARLFCEATCADGDVVCSDNCQGECSQQCPAECSGSESEAECVAGCQSSCDVECEQRCGAVDVNSGCYNHCLECMTATFHVTVNHECQFGCQSAGFADCTSGLASACQGSCSGSGSVLCDGQVVATGADTIACTDALIGRGFTLKVHADLGDIVENVATVDFTPSSGAKQDSGGCSIGTGAPGQGWLWWLGFGTFLIALRRVRRIER